MPRPRTFLQVWTRRTPPERFDAYTRWSLYVLSAGEPLIALALVGADPGFAPRPTLAWLVVVLLHTVVCLVSLRRAIDHFLGGPVVPRWLLLAVGVLSVAATVLAVPAFPVGGPDDVAGSSRYLAVLVGAGFGALSVTPLLTFRRLVVVGAVLATASGCSVMLGTGTPTASTVGIAVGLFLSVALMLVGMLGSFRVSVWMLGVVWEQERTRVLHARLAVAEERLRFSRDLHDVFGRTLSVVAVKSELAAELAARGRPGASEQMLEVRQIAQEALREVRSVVAGYRAADLPAELAGARSVLRSAGIETTVRGEQTAVGPLGQEALAWAVREGVTNVVRHSAARTCTIELRREPHGVVLEIVNDGVDEGVCPGSGSGLVGLAERLAGASGEIATWREDGRFGLVVRVPDDAAPDPAPARSDERAHVAALERTLDA